MNQLRTEPITILALSEIGERLSMAQVEYRIAAHLKNLRVDAPVLNYLWSSIMTSELEVADKRLWLVVSLQESDQHRLELAAQAARMKTADPFLDDVADVRRQVGQVKWRTLTALSAAASPLDGSRDGPDSTSTSSIRQRVKRGVKGGMLMLPGWPAPGQIEVGDLPEVLPRGPEAEISANVTWLDHENAGLRAVAIESRSAPGLTANVDVLKSACLGRAGQFARSEHGTRLQVAMDKGTRVRLNVLCHLDWATGVVVGFELRDFAAELCSEQVAS